MIMLDVRKITIEEFENNCYEEYTNLFAKNEAANKPYENLIQINGSRLNVPVEDNAFLSMDFTKQIRYGEHFKFIIPKYEINENVYQQVVFEIIASNDIRLKNTDNNISPYV